MVHVEVKVHQLPFTGQIEPINSQLAPGVAKQLLIMVRDQAPPMARLTPR